MKTKDLIYFYESENDLATRSALLSPHRDINGILIFVFLLYSSGPKVGYLIYSILARFWPN